MRRSVLLASATALITGAAVVIATPAGAATPSTTTLANSRPSWATASAKVGDLAASQQLSFQVYLPLRNESAAEAQALAVSTPGNAAYGHYLSTAQVRALYSPTAANVQAVSSWLSSAGFGVGAVPVNNAYVSATGTAARIDSVFKIKLGNYRVQGQTRRAIDRDLTLPRTIAASVASVSGLAQSLNAPLSTPSVAPPPAGFRNAQPCGAYYGQKIDTTDPAYDGQHLPYAPCGYTPPQLRQAYGIDTAVHGGLDGRGQTVAIVDAFASPTLYSDAATYAQRNDPTHPLLASQYSQYVFPEDTSLEDACGASGWYGEQTLDVEAVHGMAPGAKILYVGAASCDDLVMDNALNYIVANRLADVVSNSYGDQGEDLPAGEVTEFHNIAIQAALEGMGLDFSSGDSGDEVANVGQPEPDFSASDPLVTAVGGTSLGIGANGHTVVQTGWETGKSTLTGGAWTPPPPGAYLYGAGGGTSRLFAEPSYQVGVVPDSLARENQTGSNRGRVVPDISMDADPNTGMLIGITQTFPTGVAYGEYRIGGTSLASPLFTGLVAVSNQMSHHDHGFLNPVLYGFTAHTPAITDVVHVKGGVVRVDYVNGLDSTNGFATSVRSFDYPNLTIHTTPGYDNVTGLGVPNGNSFLALL